jgi:oxygen-independent coproporphyrinogen-3 oxidase
MSVNVKSIEHHYGIEFASHFASAFKTLQPMIDDRLIDLRYINGELQEIVVTKLGKLFLRNIAMAFDAYLPAASTPAPHLAQPVIPIYSRTI